MLFRAAIWTCFYLIAAIPVSRADGWRHPEDTTSNSQLQPFASCVAMEKWLESRPLEFLTRPSGVNLIKLGIGLGAVLSKSPPAVTGSGSSGRSMELGGAGGGAGGKRNYGGAPPPQRSPGSSPVDYTQTNNQIANVDEDDFTKNDGKYLYQLSNHVLHIVKMWPASQIAEVASIEFTQTPRSLILSGDGKLRVFLDGAAVSQAPKIAVGPTRPLTRDLRPHSVTSVATIDVNVPSNPKIISTQVFAGEFSMARFVKDTIVIALKDRIAVSDDFRDTYQDSSAEQLKKLSKTVSLSEWLGPQSSHAMTNCTNFYFNDKDATSAFTRLVSLDLKSGVASETSFFGNADQFLATDDALYTVGQTYISNRQSTIQKFLLPRKSPPKFAATGVVDGSLINSFAMDADKGFLRMAIRRKASADRDESSSVVLVLAQKGRSLETIGQTPDLAKGESLKSARFVGDVAYVVTFRQVDPLFVVSLKDPTKPRVVGELKIPGYSTYIHPIDAGSLLTIGQAADESTGRDRGLKISLFNVSDPKKPTQIDSIEAARGSFSQAMSEHHAFTFTPRQGLLAIPFAVTSYGGADSLAIFRVKGNRISFVGDATMSRPGSDIKRSMFAETYVYALSDDEVAVADTANLKARIKSVYYRGGPVNGNGGRGDDTLTVSGGLTAQEVSAVTRAHSNELLHCYEQLLQRKPAARGSLELTYSINASGDPQDVKIVKGEMEDGVMRQCAVLKVRGWQFPKPRDSGRAKVQKHLIQFNPR